jgi:hypothetical protein
MPEASTRVRYAANAASNIVAFKHRGQPDWALEKKENHIST